MQQISQIICMVYLSFLSWTDIKYRKIPVWSLAVGIVGAVLSHFGEKSTDWYLVVLGLTTGLVFIGISKVTRENFGYGDSILILALGIFLGFWNVLSLLCIAFFLAAIYSIFLLIRCRCSRKKSFPFIPFLAIGYLGGSILGSFS